MAKLSHPNVVQVYEVGQLEGRTFVAMELVKGQTPREWMQREPRPEWRQCVRLFIQLGDGLAAAHAQGLIHRDFKPGNAIIDDQGRARVLDFGLARYVNDGETLTDSVDTQSARTGPQQVVTSQMSLTETGAVLGTPAYMPLEQMLGQEADARSDQFSFCVSLHEAIYGERPFEGATMMALMVAMKRGMLRPAPKGTKVPAALRKVLLRGLAVEPEQRWPSMEALLDELRRLSAPRGRRLVVLGVTAGLAALGGGLGYAAHVQVKDRCTGARAQLEGVWDGPRRRQVEGALLQTERSYAPQTWARVEARLDDYAEAWVREHTEACEATSVRREQSAEHMDLRMGCLGQRRLRLRAMVDELAQADASSVEHAAQAVASLPGLSRCSDLEALRAEVPPPEDPDVAQQVEALTEQLAVAESKRETGKYAEGLTMAEAVVAEAEALGYAPLLVRAQLRQGTLQADSGDYEAAVNTLQQAYHAALARRMLAEAAEASTILVSLLGARLTRYDEARRWAVDADPLSLAAGTDEARALYLNNLGNVANSERKLDEARDLYQQALDLYQRTLGPDHPHVAGALTNLGNVADSQGEFDEALDLMRRALAIRQDTLGPDHPHVAISVTSLGHVARAQGKLDEARELYQRALGIRRNALGPDHPSVASSLDHLGGIAHAQGNLDEGLDLFREALAIRQRTLGPDHDEVGNSFNQLGRAAYARGKIDEAREYFERALAVAERALGPDHAKVGFYLGNVGAIAKVQGELDVALDFYQRGLAIHTRTLGPDHPSVALFLTNLGELALSKGQLDEAHDFFERTLAVRREALGPDHPDVGDALHNLATVARSRGELGEARDFNQRALAIFEQALGSDHPKVAYALTDLGSTLLGLDEPAEALLHLERALTIRTTHELDPALPAATRFVLARALWAAPVDQGRDRPRARALAEHARDAWARGGSRHEDDLARVQAWLAEHELR